MKNDIEKFIATYLIPEIDAEITDGDLRRTIYNAIDKAEEDFEKDNKIEKLYCIKNAEGDYWNNDWG